MAWARPPNVRLDICRKLPCKVLTYGAIALMLFLYLIAYLSNPGCAPYKPKAELQLNTFFGKWYAQYMTKPWVKKYGLAECVSVEFYRQAN